MILEKGQLASYLVMASRQPLEVFKWTSGLPASWPPHPHPLGTIMIHINSGSAVTEAKIRDDWCSVKYALVTGFPGLGGGGAGFPGRECGDYRGALD